MLNSLHQHLEAQFLAHWNGASGVMGAVWCNEAVSCGPVQRSVMYDAVSCDPVQCSVM